MSNEVWTVLRNLAVIFNLSLPLLFFSAQG